MFNIGIALKEGRAEIDNITDVSFDLRVTLEGQPIDTFIYMSLSETNG